MERDYQTKGTPLIKTVLGTINATKENFNMTSPQYIEDENWRTSIGAEGGTFCLAPWELDQPF